MTDLMVLSFPTVEAARDFWEHGEHPDSVRPEMPDAALVWRAADGAVHVAAAGRDRAGPPVVHWPAVASALFVVPVAEGVTDIPLRRARDAGLDDALLRKTAGSLSVRAAAVIALLRRGVPLRVRALAHRHRATMLRAHLSSEAEGRLVRTLGRAALHL